mgnify:CR=1 FL=1
MLEYVEIREFLYAIVIRDARSAPGVNFITDGRAILQVGTMRHPTGHKIQPHRHLPYKRNTEGTQEVLFLRSGVLKVSFFCEKFKEVGNILLNTGDTIILMGGAHGFEIIEEVDMIEVKNGPYASFEDKERFSW